MLVYAGIDEAGYGPMLGPLCVAGSVFVLEDYDPGKGAPDLWEMLEASVCRSRRDKRQRIAIDDSKRLKGARNAKAHPLRHLERGVLSFHAASSQAHALPATDGELIADLGGQVAPHPWHDSVTPLPVGQAADELRILISRLDRTLASRGVRCQAIWCRLVDAGDLNEQAERMGKKSAVNFRAIMSLVDLIRRRWGKDHPRVIVDRQGGRTHYLRELQLAYPEDHLHILAESEELSRYRLENPASPLTISFVKGAEERHFPVALASMTAKYVRELLMIRLNRYFQGFLPELKPTAGYVQDGRRYVGEIEAVIRAQGLARRRLIRSI